MPERPSLTARLLRPIVQLRDGESTTALLMFLFSFLAMTSYNIIKPITRSEFISSLGADNLPYVQFGAGVLIGFIMQGYTRVMRAVPRRRIIPVTQVGIAVLLVLFWFLFTTIGQDWIAVAFYIVGLILAVLLISQFWTLANDIYDPRQAKRIFGFIGGGASLGGATGAALTVFLVEIARREEHAADRRRDHGRCASRSCCSCCGARKRPAPAIPRRRSRRKAPAAREAISCCARRGTCR